MLKLLAQENTDNQFTIAREDGALNSLVRLLRDETTIVAKYEAAGALRDLASHPENQLLIAREGAIAPLLAVARSSHASSIVSTVPVSELKKEARGALENLAINSANHQALVDAFLQVLKPAPLPPRRKWVYWWPNLRFLALVMASAVIAWALT